MNKQRDLLKNFLKEAQLQLAQDYPNSDLRIRSTAGHHRDTLIKINCSIKYYLYKCIKCTEMCLQQCQGSNDAARM